MIRDFLYVDVQRTRSLLAQLDDGVVEQHVKRSALDDAGELGATIFGIGGKGTWGTQESYEESRSLKDLTFVVFEEAADAQGLIAEVEPSSDPSDWDAGIVHGQLREGEILRVTGDVLITDPAYIRARFESLDDFMTALIDMQVQGAVEAAKVLGAAQLDSLQGQLQKSNPGQRKQIERKIKAAEDQMEEQARREVEAQLGGSAGMDQMRSVMKVLSSFIGDAIAVRLLACGLDHPEMGFAGSLLARDEYLQRERDELFSRYGSILRDWTTVMQVAHVPQRDESASAMDLDRASLAQLASGQAINRAAFERTAAQLLRMMETIGITEGPRWPTISVVPLGIYRQVPASELAEANE